MPEGMQDIPGMLDAGCDYFKNNLPVDEVNDLITKAGIHYSVGNDGLGVIQVLRNARGGGWVYAQAL